MTTLNVQAQRLLAQRRPCQSSPESFIWTLIILSASQSMILSSVSICDGHWLLVEDHQFGLWHFCMASNQTAAPHCLRDLSQHGHLGHGGHHLWLVLLTVSQVYEDLHSRRKWAMGSVLLLVSFIHSFGGLLIFWILLRNQVTLIGLTLIFWSQLAASVLFFLKAISGLISTSSPTSTVSPIPWAILKFRQESPFLC
uniref:Uncharacterized protein n=1 Tax=Sus scrofa TaxID=9823 RepID=A0A8D0UVD4_PIG